MQTCPDHDVLINTVGCLTNLTTFEDHKLFISRSGVLQSLLKLVSKTRNINLQRNATSTIVNLTHSPVTRAYLVQAGVIPVLTNLLMQYYDDDEGVAYSVVTAISNLAVDTSSRTRLIPYMANIIPILVKCLSMSTSTSSTKLQTQAALGLRNLASDEAFAKTMVSTTDIVFRLKELVEASLNYLSAIVMDSYSGSPSSEAFYSVNDSNDTMHTHPISLSTTLAVMACLRNLSIWSENEPALLQSNLFPVLLKLFSIFSIPTHGSTIGFSKPFLDTMINPMQKSTCLEILVHTVATIRNLVSCLESAKFVVETEDGRNALDALLWVLEYFGVLTTSVENLIDEAEAEASTEEIKRNNSFSIREMVDEYIELKTEISGTLAVLAYTLPRELQSQLLEIGSHENGERRVGIERPRKQFLETMVSVALNPYESSQVRANAATAIAYLSSLVVWYRDESVVQKGILVYLEEFLGKKDDWTLRQVATWSLLKFMNGGDSNTSVTTSSISNNRRNSRAERLKMVEWIRSRPVLVQRLEELANTKSMLGSSPGYSTTGSSFSGTGAVPIKPRASTSNNGTSPIASPSPLRGSALTSRAAHKKTLSMDFYQQSNQAKLLRSNSYDTSGANGSRIKKRSGNTTASTSTHRGASRDEEAEIMRMVKEHAGKVLDVVKPGNRFLGEVIDDVEGGKEEKNSQDYVEELKSVFKERRSGTI